MTNKSIRLLMLVAFLGAIGIIITQTYWVRKAYQLQEKEFELKTNLALRNVASNIAELKHIQLPIYSPVEQISPDFYIVQINVQVEKEVLAHFLQASFTRQNITTNFWYGLYDCMSDTVQYAAYINMQGNVIDDIPSASFKKLKKLNYHFAVYFPNRKHFLSQQLSVWIVSTIVLIFILILLTYLLFIILKQKRLSEIQKDFVNNMTHEFKTPLASIQLSADVLKNPTILHNEQRLLNYATIISTEAKRLSHQVERVLQMAQGNKGEIQLSKSLFVWQTLIKETLSSFDQAIALKRATINLDLPTAPISYFGDQLHLRNCISNLIDNALKYTETDPVITISIGIAQQLRIAVEDNGIGINKNDQKLLFKKFYRVNTGNIHNVKGFGLGLSYVRLIINAHNGRIECESDLGKGTKFVIYLPITN
jgi:two-component system phosphate regulon sensor histidine kinase PhoR